MIEALRDLHAPVVYNGSSRATCDGCDFDGYEAESPEWPCRTAEIVYTEDEIAETLTAIQQAAKWHEQMSLRNRSLAPATGLAAIIAGVYSQMIEDQLRTGPLWQRMVEYGNVETNTHSATITISKQLLEDVL